jgi:cystathionine gamma-synthase
VEGKAAALEGGEAALLFGSGMAALTTTLLAHLRAGDHLVATRGVYRRTADFFRLVLPRYGVEATLVPPDEPASLETAIRPETRLLFTECPSNPYLRVPDLDRLSGIARRHGLPSVVDATFATPVNLRPLEHGFDVVVHSATKYLGGHNDLMAGLAIGRRERLSPVEELRGTLGPCAGARDAGLLLRGLKTLDLRVRRQNETALRVARFLEACPAVERVHYPGLPSHPDHGTACRLMSGFGGVVSFEVRGGLDAASRLVDRLRLPFIGPTLGGVESIVQQPALFVSTDPRKREEAGMADNLVRYALGIEDADDILADLEQALAGF